jgi:DNA ligase 4
MPFPFLLVCQLLENVHKHCSSRSRQSNDNIVIEWFAENRAAIDAEDVDASALLSTLLPEKRTDRVYGIKAPSLERIVGRAMGLGSSRIRELTLYRQPGLGKDLADCVESIFTSTVSAIPGDGA